MRRIVSVFLMCFILAACSGRSNPLLTGPVHVVAKWLYHNELKAMAVLHFYDTDGSIYLACVRDPQRFNNPINQQSGPQRCQQLFHELVQLAKQSNQFKQLTISDLNNQAVAKRVGKALSQLVMSEGQS